MELNIEVFGAGVGIVLIGWAAGLVVSYLFSISVCLGRLGRKS